MKKKKAKTYKKLVQQISTKKHVKSMVEGENNILVNLTILIAKYFIRLQ